MLPSILGARLSRHFGDGWVFEPAIVGPDLVEYSHKEGPHAGPAPRPTFPLFAGFCCSRISPGSRLMALGALSGWQTLFSMGSKSCHERERSQQPTLT